VDANYLRFMTYNSDLLLVLRWVVTYGSYCRKPLTYKQRLQINQSQSNVRRIIDRDWSISYSYFLNQPYSAHCRRWFICSDVTAYSLFL